MKRIWALLAMVFSLPLLANAALAKVVVNVDLSSQRMNVYVDGQHYSTWRISSGRRGYFTPRGTYRPKWLKRMHYSSKYNNAPMPYSIFYHGGYAIHGTDVISRLGYPASHGCIRLHPSNAAKLFSLVKKHGKRNTIIRISGSTAVAYARLKPPVRKRIVRKRYTRKKARRYYRKRYRQYKRWRRPRTYLGFLVIYDGRGAP